MERMHRNLILKNIESLIKETNYIELVNSLLAREVLSDQMVYTIDTTYLTINERHRALFKKITHRGPTAFEQLKCAFIDNGFTHAQRLLDPDDDSHFTQRKSLQPSKLNNTNNNNNNNTVTEGCSGSKSSKPTDTVELIEQFEPKTNKFGQIKLSATFHKAKLGGVYSMRSKNRGVLFLVNIINFTKSDPREGSNDDTDAMTEIFLKMGFHVFAYTNCKKKEFFTLLDKLLETELVKNTDCFILALMSHGDTDENNVEWVEFTDVACKVPNIEQYFTNSSCLANKPKVLIFPFCRGKQKDFGVNVKRRPLQTDSRQENFVPMVLPTMSDVLVCYATNTGYVAHRDPDQGSWYIQELCKVLAEHAHDTDFESIIKKVMSNFQSKVTVEGVQQTPTTRNIGFKNSLFINPGYYGESENNNSENSKKQLKQ